MAQMFFPGTANPGDVVAGRTFSAGANYQTQGTLIDRPQGLTTSNYVVWDNNGTKNLAVRIPLGAYRSPWSGPDVTEIQIVENSLRSDNIKSGTNILGVSGSFRGVSAKGRATVSSSTAPFSTPSDGSSNRYYVTVSGLAFKPTVIIVWGILNTTNYASIYFEGANGILWGWGFGSALITNIITFTFTESTSTTSPSSSALLTMDGTIRTGYVNSTGFCMPVGWTSSSVAGDSAFWYAYGNQLD